MTFQLRDPEMRGNYGSSGEERVGLESFLKSQCQSSIWPSKPEQNSKWTDLKYQLRGKTIGLFSMPKVRALRAGFWEQLKATIKRNVLRKMRNKRHTIRVNRHLYQFCQFPISGGGGSHLLHGHHHYLEAHPEKSVHGSCLGSAWSFKCDIYNASARVKTPNNQRIFLHSHNNHDALIQERNRLRSRWPHDYQSDAKSGKSPRSSRGQFHGSGRWRWNSETIWGRLLHRLHGHRLQHHQWKQGSEVHNTHDKSNRWIWIQHQRYKIRMTSDDSGLHFQMPGPNARIGEESCRESGSNKSLEVRILPGKPSCKIATAFLNRKFSLQNIS